MYYFDYGILGIHKRMNQTSIHLISPIPIPTPASARLEEGALVSLTRVPAAAAGPRAVMDTPHLFSPLPRLGFSLPPPAFLLVWVVELVE